MSVYVFVCLYDRLWVLLLDMMVLIEPLCPQVETFEKKFPKKCALLRNRFTKTRSRDEKNMHSL